MSSKGWHTTLYPHAWFIPLLLILVVVLFLADLSFGSVSIPFSDVWSVILGDSANEGWSNIIWRVRMPEAITALLAGAGLSVCGLQMQSLFRNPLAGPSVLGITSGATLGVALLILSSSALGATVWLNSEWASLATAIAALIGVVVVMLIIVAIASRFRESVTILIVGLMIGFAISALVSILSYYSSREQLQQFVFWGFGSFESVSLTKLWFFAPGVMAGLLLSLVLLKPMNALLLGDDYARSLGVNLRATRITIILCTGLLAGWITAFCGPIAFLGLAVPHITRNILHTTDHRVLFPATVLTGSALALLCAFIADLPGYDGALPLNAVTSLIGAPTVVWIIVRQNKMHKAF